MSNLSLAVVGGGAAGFFGAVAAADAGASVVLYERSPKLLAKVRISGGGRCNVTHACPDVKKLARHYPRGGKALRGAFRRFGVRETVDWFERQDVRLKTEADGRMFPVTDTSQTVIDALRAAAQRAGVRVRCRAGVRQVRPEGGGFVLSLDDGTTVRHDRVLVAAGGHPQSRGYDWLRALDVRIHNPIPSLFTFNVPQGGLSGLPGVATPARVWLDGPDVGVRGGQAGPVLLTHWGFSGPAIIRLSAWEAARLHHLKYHFDFRVDWAPDYPDDALRDYVRQRRQVHGRQQVGTYGHLELPQRLWAALVARAGLPAATRWSDVTRGQTHALVEQLRRGAFSARGKTTFKEEFVTAGGVALDEVDLTTFGSKRHAGLYFAGEVLDVDGVTGGFNFQAAWTTGFLAGTAAGSRP